MNIPGAGLGNNNNIPGGLGININNNGLPLLRATLVQVKKNLKRFLGAVASLGLAMSLSLKSLLKYEL